MTRLTIKESIENETGELNIFTRSNNLLLRQSPFQLVQSDFERRHNSASENAIQNHIDSFQRVDLIEDLQLDQCALYFPNR
jgi:hypothetical protein